MMGKKLKIIIITQGISRIVRPLLKSEYEIVGILECAPRKIEKKSCKFRVLLFLKQLFLKPRSLKQLAKAEKIPYYFMLKSDDTLSEWVKNLVPDVMVVYSMSQLLKKDLFTLPRNGTINLHPTMLPKYRGPNPDFWMYYETDLNPGVTVHYIDEGEDTGDIICQKQYTISLGTKSPDMLDIGVSEIGVNLIFEALDLISSNQVIRKKQPQDSETRRARLLKADEHNKIIDWKNWPIERIWHILRGTELWLNAIEQPKGIFAGQRWSILNFEKKTSGNYILGKVYRENKKSFVACRDGVIYLTINFSIKRMIIKFF